MRIRERRGAYLAHSAAYSAVKLPQARKLPEHPYTSFLSNLRANLRRFHSMEGLAILPGMENVGDEQGCRRYLIANFIVVHDEAPDLTGSENR